MTYSISTKKSWSATMSDLAIEFERWGVTEWDTNYPRGARLEGFNQDEVARTVTLTYTLRGKPITLKMGSQSRAVDNLRVLFLAVEAMRLNEKRGIGEIIEQAYLQLAGPTQERSPWEILGIFPGLPVSVAEAMYKEKAKTAHPDRGGSQEEMRQLNDAIEKIRNGLA